MLKPMTKDEMAERYHDDVQKAYDEGRAEGFVTGRLSGIHEAMARVVTSKGTSPMRYEASQRLPVFEWVQQRHVDAVLEAVYVRLWKLHDVVAKDAGETRALLGDPPFRRVG